MHVFCYNRDMSRLTQKQKQEIRAKARFWAIHASHWGVLTAFVIVTFSLLYTFWGNDQVFAAMMMGN